VRPWGLGTSWGQLDYPLEWKESVQLSPEFCTPESVLRVWRIGNGCSSDAHDSNASWHAKGGGAFPVGSFLDTADNGFSYSINQSAKEVLYVPTSSDEKYKAEAFIDMFIQPKPWPSGSACSSLSHSRALRAFVGFRWQPFSFWFCRFRLHALRVGSLVGRLRNRTGNCEL